MKELYYEIEEVRYAIDTLRARLNYLKYNSKSIIVIDCALNGVDNIEKSIDTIKNIIEEVEYERYV